MDYRQLQLFVAAAQRCNLSQAAEVMGITQPGLSKSLHKLQQELGVRLYTRHGRGIELSEAGRTLMEHGLQVEERLADTRTVLAGIARGELGHARIGGGPAWSDELLPAAIAAVLERNPKLRFSVDTGFPERLIGRLRRGELDLVVGALPLNRRDPDLRVERLTADDIRVIGRVGHPLLSVPSRTIADYARYSWVLPTRAELLHQRLSVAFRRAGLGEPRIAVEGDARHLLFGTVRRTDCLGLTTSREIGDPSVCGIIAIDHTRLRFRREAGLIGRRNAEMPTAARILAAELRRLAAV